MISHPLFILATGIAGGITAAFVAVGSGELLGQSVSVDAWIGLAVVGSLGSAVLLYAKNKFIALIEKVEAMPSKVDFDNSVNRIEGQSTRHKAELVREIGVVYQRLLAVQETFTQAMHSLELRTAAIESRHDTEDRIQDNRNGER